MTGPTRPRFTLVVLAAALGCALAALGYARLPGEDQLLAMSRNLQFWVDAKDGEPTFRQHLFSYPVQLDDIASPVVEATLAMEDTNFFVHPGFDPRGIARAVVGRLLGRPNPGGGSTISQQLAKTLLLSGDRSIRRKLKEVALAIKLEARFSKFELLQLYLNRVDYGSRAQGIEAAARTYFGKRASALNTYEAALLVGSVPAPNRNNLKVNPERAHARAGIVLARLEALGKLRAADVSKRHGGGKAKLRELRHREVFDALRANVRDVLRGRSGRFVVVTTIEPEVQLYAEHALKRAQAKALLGEAGAGQAALVALGNDGAIRAMVGTVDWRLSQFNRALRARRQIGSTVKPLVYLAAYEGGIASSEMVSGARYREGNWSPRNIDGRYPERLTLSDALVRSVNTAAVRVQARVGRDAVRELGKQLADTIPLPDSPGLALGLSEAAPVDVARLYASFANGGRPVTPFLLKGVRGPRGRVIHWHSPDVSDVHVNREALAALNADLEAVVRRGTGRAASLVSAGHHVAGKTGTTQNHVDAWFAGYTESLTAVVWVGNDDNAPMRGVTGGGVPAKLWRRFMLNVLEFTRYEAGRVSALDS